ncbi:hypothetical protein ACWELJ_21885, partial [Nocardia sp. NPDC004582]
MSSEPTSDDATKREPSAAQPGEPTVRPGDSTAQPVDLGKPDSTPTEVLGARQDATTDWWNDPANTGDPATPDPDAQPTQVLHPGEAAYAAGATVRPGTGSAPTADTAKLAANGTGPT